MQLSQPTPDALVSFSDFLLERFGLVATMQVAVIASIAFHVVAIVGLGFNLPKMMRDAAPHNMMDVVLVNSKSAARPTKADALAQANLDGGGNTDKKLRASTPFPALDREPAPELKAAEARVKQLEAEQRELMAQIKSKATIAPVEQQAPAGVLKADSREARELIERNLEIERLEAQIRRDHQAYQERPRRRFIGARAQEYRFAQYIDTWRLRIERIGNLNYPEEARARRIYASLTLTVAIKKDGEIESVEINKSSGYPFLDRAAQRIVRLAAPFEPFPGSIKSDTDILHITRTWTFTRADQVTTE
ncbi:MAG TPA: energy transducer TonB [Usitatibacter sp.]|nr:energy transducer TonB [Usitatibacter sp.]